MLLQIKQRAEIHEFITKNRKIIMFIEINESVPSQLRVKGLKR